jgi:flagellar biosynthesis chaperone FliJ
MKAFKFRLETLLHLRELAKDKAISEYGKSIRIREEAENNLFAKEQELVGLREEIGLRRSSGFRVVSRRIITVLSFGLRRR